MKKSFPNLKIIPTKALILHEYTDPQRVSRLKARFRNAGGILKNPVLVCKLKNGNYVVLDGANRTTVFDELGIQHILVQVVEYKQPQVLLKTWNHLVCDPRFKKYYTGSVKKFKQDEIKTMSDFVQAYKGKYKFYRVLGENFLTLKKQYKNATCLVVFPKFEPKDIINLSTKGQRIPSGITRHVVSGRALRVLIPLNILRAEVSLNKKNKWLSKRVLAIIKENKIRYYEEPVFIFDE